MALGMRTIYVAIRGINYTDRATREVGDNVDKMIKKQEKLRAQMVQTFAAGIMWAAMAGMIVMGILKIMEASVAGRTVLRGFTRSINQLTKALADQFAKILGPLISGLSKFIEIMSKNESVMRMITGLVIIATVLMAVQGATMLLGVAVQYLGGMFTSASSTLALWSTSAEFASFSTMTLAGAFGVLRASLSPAVIMFMAAYQAAMFFGEYAWALIPIIVALTAVMTAYAAASWSAAIALSILTFGAAALIGVGAAMYAQSQVPSYKIGTSYVQKTGPAIVHQGEQIIPAGERQVRAQTQQPFPVRKNMIEVHIGTVQTKADKEELGPLILKTVKEAMDNKV